MKGKGGAINSNNSTRNLYSVNAIMRLANASGLSFRNTLTSIFLSDSLSLSLSLAHANTFYYSHVDKNIKAKYS